MTELIIKGAEKGLWEFSEPDTPAVIVVDPTVTVVEEYYENNENNMNSIENENYKNYIYREGE